jgi:hypothetical protein
VAGYIDGRERLVRSAMEQLASEPDADDLLGLRAVLQHVIRGLPGRSHRRCGEREQVIDAVPLCEEVIDANLRGPVSSRKVDVRDGCTARL